MIKQKLTLTVFFVLACSFVLILPPIAAQAQVGGVIHGAQRGVEKGAGAVKQGAETGVQKGKEGAEAVGRGTKEVITGEDKNQNQGNNRMKSTESQSETKSTETTTEATTRKNLPKTAGELPLLALAGCLALAAAVTIRFRASAFKRN